MGYARSWDVLLVRPGLLHAFMVLIGLYDSRFKLILNDPSKPPTREEDSEEVIGTKALEHNVLALPGTSFLPAGGKTAYVRASFSLLEKDNVEEALRRLKDTILEARS